jgi:hypothetical protein
MVSVIGCGREIIQEKDKYLTGLRENLPDSRTIGQMNLVSKIANRTSEVCQVEIELRAPFGEVGKNCLRGYN